MSRMLRWYNEVRVRRRSRATRTVVGRDGEPRDRGPAGAGARNRQLTSGGAAPHRHGAQPPLTPQRPLYARLLRLRHLNPGAAWCFVLFEGSLALAVLLALAELVSWWGVLALPAAVAAMVKINDWVAGAVATPVETSIRFSVEGRHPVVGRAVVPSSLPGVEPFGPGLGPSGGAPPGCAGKRVSGPERSYRSPEPVGAFGPGKTSDGAARTARAWAAHAAYLESLERWIRQSASRRYG